MNAAPTARSVIAGELRKVPGITREIKTLPAIRFRIGNTGIRITALHKGSQSPQDQGEDDILYLEPLQLSGDPGKNLQEEVAYWKRWATLVIREPS